MTATSGTDLQRLRYRRGQLLRSRDFTDQLADDAERRRWHNRALHQPLGAAVGLDLEVKATVEKDSQGNKTVLALHLEVRPGIGYDCRGEPTFVGCTMALDTTVDTQDVKGELDDTDPQRPVPAALKNAPEVPGLAVLSPRARLSTIGEILAAMSQQVTEVDRRAVVIRRKAGTFRSRLRHHQPGCDSTDDCGGLEAVIVLASDVDPGTDLVVADVVVRRYTNTSPQVDIHWPSIVSHHARPYTRPLIATGATVPGATAWTEWKPDGPVRGFEVKVDTRSAGFAAPPFYFAWLQGPVLKDVAPTVYLPVLYEHVDEEQAGSFVFRLFMPNPGTNINQNFGIYFPKLARENKLYVAWLAVQPIPSPFDDPRMVALAREIFDGIT